MASADFSCAICFDAASDPVVTRCGHLFCWDCLDHWLSRRNAILECPVCKGRTDPEQPGDIIPLYGKGRRSKQDTRPKAPGEASTPTTDTTSSDAAAASPEVGGGVNPRPHTGASTAADASEPAAMPHHERPHAPRAPTPPHPPQRTRRGAAMFGLNAQTGTFGRTQWSFSSLGFPIMFFGVDSLMTPIILLGILVYCAYRFLPWREWKRNFEQRRRQGGGAPAADANHSTSAEAHATATQVDPNTTVQGPAPLPSADVVAQMQWESIGVVMLVLGLALLVVY